MTDQTHFDLIVIGTGPGGEGAAMRAAKAGKSVAAIERYSAVGGGATHWGTIPSKAIRRAIYNVRLMTDNPIYKRIDVVPEFSFPDMVASAERVVGLQADLRQGFFDRNGVPLIPGSAKFAGPGAVDVTLDTGAVRRYSADAFVIATGSRPYRPADIDFAHPRIFESDTLLRMDFTPPRIAVYGAGVIGCEYASMLRNLRLDVTLIDTRERLLSFLDDEISDALSYHFSDTGISILHKEEYERVEGREKDVVIHLKSGKKVRVEALLFTNGRSGNTDGLGLDTLGIVPNSRGQIEVNEHFQVRKPAPKDAPPGGAPPEVIANVYAVGDVVGWPSLASASYDQGRFAASHLLGEADYRLVKDVPTGIYTSPEISSLGKTERELTDAKIPYAVGKALFKTLARAQITGQTQGMLKILFHRQTLEILGIHCFGDTAAEIIHIGQAIMAQPAPNNSINYFLHTTFNYPTMAEAYRVAALRGLDRVYRE